MTTRRTPVLLAGVMALALLSGACAEETPAGGGGGGGQASPSPSPAAEFTTIQEGILTVGSCLDYPPFESVEAGDEVGFDVDLSEEIAGRLGLEVEWVRADFDTIFTAVDAGQFDMVAAASTITEERQQTVDFSDPYYNSRQALVVAEGSDIVTEADIQEGHIVGVQRGTTGKAYAEDNLEAEIKTFTNAPDAFRDLEAGNIDAVVNDEPASAAIIEDFPGQILIAAAIDTNEKYGFAFSKDNPELTEAVNGAFAEIVADGTYTEIFERYFPGVEVPPEFQASG